jgi:hypothetical protein
MSPINQAGIAIAKFAGFECDLLHTAGLFSSLPRALIPVGRPGSGAQEPCVLTPVAKQWSVNGEGWVRAMSTSDDAEFDFDRYRRLLAEADDEQKRLAFINLLVDEKAKDKLAGQSLRGRLAELRLPPKK